MAKVQQQPKKPIKKKQKVSVVTLPEKENYYIIIAGVAIIVLGYILLAMGGVEDALALVISPIILVIGYCVVIPIGIMYRRKTREKANV